jgi:hypothetical protein
MKLSSPSILIMSTTTVFTVTAFLSSLVSAVNLKCDIDTLFNVEGEAGVTPVVPSKSELVDIGHDLLTTFQAAYVNNDDWNMVRERFSRFSMKKINHPAFIDTDDDDTYDALLEEEEDNTLPDTVLPEDVANLIFDSSADAATHAAGNLRGGGASSGEVDVIDEEDGEEKDQFDENHLGIPGRAKRRRRRRQTRKPTQKPKEVYEKVEWSYNFHQQGDWTCRWCLDDRRGLVALDENTISESSDSDGTTPTMALTNANEHHEWETTFCGRLKAKFPHATHCYISVSNCSPNSAAVVLEGEEAGDDQHVHDDLAYLLISDLRESAMIDDFDANLDSYATDDGGMVVYTVQALNQDQAATVMLSSASSAGLMST